MKQLITLFAAVLTMIFSSTAFAISYSNPTCILMKFSNDTRFQSIDAASALSDLVIEKMLKTEKFNLRETKPIEHDMEIQLYKEKIRDVDNAKVGLRAGNFNALFEGPGFDPVLAEAIATAEIGQVISPPITSAIGRDHGAQFLIQGTIINMGSDLFEDELNFNSGGGGLYFHQKESALGIQTDLRVIEAATGEVIWRKIVTGSDKKTMTQVGAFKFGSSKMTSDMYSEALEDAAQKIVDAMITDIHKLFFKPWTKQ